jgi:hypothetical protein
MSGVNHRRNKGLSRRNGGPFEKHGGHNKGQPGEMRAEIKTGLKEMNHDFELL